MENYESIASLSCAGCLNDIGNDDYVTALGQDWHKECFRCSVCDSLLSTWYFEKNGLLFCRDDYWTRYGKCCQQCTQVITGPVMTAGEHRFHPECFACSLCGANIEDGEPYALLERSKLFCGACYDTGVSSSEKGTHSIRVQDVPAAAIDTAPIDNKLMVTRGASLRDKLSSLVGRMCRAALALCVQVTCHSINTACGLLSLHIGDRILEINGSPVKSSSVERAEKMLASSDAVLQLTIEHNPATTNNNIPTKTSIPQNPPTNRSELKDCPTNQRGELNEGSTNQIVALKNRSLNRVALKDYTTQNIPEHSAEGKEGKRERLFKRKGEGEGKGRVMKRRQTPSSPLFGHKEKSSSMSELLDVVDGEEQNGGVLGELSRARSFRGEPPGPGQKVFLPCDLLQGELLGSGFFGQVYKVTHRATNEVMVLKQLYRVDEDAQRNFIKEVAVLRSLTHPNVLRFVGVLYRDKRLHLITEYVAGGTLYQLIQDTATPLSWVERARLARDVASGVGYLHRRDVIHRDLNSHNCLVREDKTVIVADFGLARIVQRAGAGTLERRRSAHSTLRRKRYTVVGNPYWMAPEMMNGNVYDEKVDIFSFGIILCEIIGRVSADPDFLPRRSDFGLNEPAFIESFCGDSPEPFYRIAFLACDLDPDRRPSFEVMEEWLERLIIHLSHASPMLRGLLQEVTSYGAADCCEKQDQVLKSSSNAAMLERCSLASGAGRALGKCVSASHIGGGRRTVTVTNLSRSQQSLATAPQGFILRADGCSINLTRVDDITQWIDAPRPLKRAHADGMLNQEPDTRKVEDVPAFFRNQSVEGLETDSKREGDVNNLCRHLSIPDRSVDSDSSDDDLNDSDWYKNVSSFRKLDKIDAEQKSATKIMKEDPSNVVLRNPNERKIPEEDSRRYNIDHLQKTRGMAEGIRNIAKAFEPKPPEKTNFFTKTLLSPKLSRLFKSSEVVRNKPQTDDKSKSKFFVQTPPPIGRSTYRVRPFDETDKHTEFQNRKNLRDNVIKNDLKLASLGKPMTPVFRRHNPKETPAFGDGRFSYRDRKCIYANADSKFVDVGRNRIKAPVSDVKSTAANKRTIQAALPAVEEKCKVEVADSKVGPKKREMAISRSNYVSLANLKINTRSKDTAKGLNSRDPLEENCPVERVI